MIDHEHATAIALGHGVHASWPNGSIWTLELDEGSPDAAIEFVRAQGHAGALTALSFHAPGLDRDGNLGALVVTVDAYGAARGSFLTPTTIAPVHIMHGTAPLTMSQLIRAGLN